MRQTWDELDVLRGFAALLMIFNHAGVEWYGDEPSRTTIEGFLTYLGSFAPVAFFLLTGLGYGVAPVGNRNGTHRYGLANKVGILVFADVLLAWQHGYWVGLNFLGFIGISTLVLEKLREAKYPFALAVVAAGAVLGVRFVVGPVVLARFGSAAGWFTGANGIDGLAYNPFPWLFYPFFGYVLGRVAQRWSDEIRAGSLLAYGLHTAGALVSWAAAEMLTGAGRPAFRWGVVTIAFFAQSMIVVFAGLLAVLVAHRSRTVSTWLEPLRLRGVSSLAVVPLHYVVLLALGLLVPRPPTVSAFVMFTIVACVASLFISRQLAAGIAQMTKLESRAAVWNTLVGLVAASGVVLLGQQGAAGGIGVVVLALGQLALCALLVVRKPAPVQALRPAPRT